MSVLSRLVEAARKGYFEASRPHVIVHSVSAVSVLSCAQINTFFLNKKNNSITMVLNSAGATSNKNSVVH